MFHYLIKTRNFKYIGVHENLQAAHDDAVRCLASHFNISFDRALRWINTTDNMAIKHGSVTVKYFKD